MACILIADDDEVQRRFVAKELAQLGHETLFARNGEEAILTLRQQHVDLLLLDMHMPVMDGAETFEQIRKIPQFREIPILILSGAEGSNVVDFIARGADDYLLKSTDPSARALLRARVASCLQRKQLRDAREDDLRRLRHEQQKVNWLLSTLFPFDVVQQMLQALDDGGATPLISIEPRVYSRAAVMFCDIVGFTSFCETNDPRLVVGFLKDLVTQMEQIAARHNLEKIKTIGDSFMATSGLRIFLPNPVRAAVECGFEMMRAAARLPPYWKLRIGIDFGPVVGGIVGNEKFQYDVWGRTVNLAARVECEGRDGHVNLSEAAWNQVADLFEAELATVAIKGIGEQSIFVIPPPPGLS